MFAVLLKKIICPKKVAFSKAIVFSTSSVFFVQCMLKPVLQTSWSRSENCTRGQNFIRTGPGTARKSWSVLEQDPEPAEASS